MVSQVNISWLSEFIASGNVYFSIFCFCILLFEEGAGTSAMALAAFIPVSYTSLNCSVVNLGTSLWSPTLSPLVASTINPTASLPPFATWSFKVATICLRLALLTYRQLRQFFLSSHSLERTIFKGGAQLLVRLLNLQIFLFFS